MGIGMRELLVILLIALVLFGAKRLRSIGSDLGGALRGFKDAVAVDDISDDPAQLAGDKAAQNAKREKETLSS